MNGIAIDPTVLSAAIGLGIAVVLAAGLIKWHKQVLSAIGLVFKAIFTWSGFFWIVNLSCMAYSAQNAGYIFGLYESTGVIVGIAIDGLIIAFTQTMLAAKARGEYRRAAQILMFIVFCCLLSTIGNLAHNLHTNIDTQTSGVWFSQLIPYAVSTMPLFLIALAWVADLKVNPLDKEDPDKYQSDEEKQIRFQEIQIESNEKRAALQTRGIAVEALRRRNNALRRGKVPGSFRWFWEKAVDTAEVVAGVSTQLKALFDPQIEQMRRELETLRKEKGEFVAHLEETNTEKMTQFQESFRSFVDELLKEIRVDIHSENEQYCLDLGQQNEQYRLGLGQQYDQDITIIKNQLTSRIDDVLSDIKTTISQDVITLQEAFNQALIASRKTAKSDNVIEMTPEVELVVNRYPIVSSWLMRAERSVTLQEIIDGTGHTPHMIHKRAKEGVFRRTRRDGYYRLDSVITWLRTAPLPRIKEETNQEIKEEKTSEITETNALPNTDQIEVITPEKIMANGSDIKNTSDEEVLPASSSSAEIEVMVAEHITTNGSDVEALSSEEVLPESSPSVETEVITTVDPTPKSPDKLAITARALRENPQITDEELKVILGLKRAASARLWRVKVQTMLEQEQSEGSPALEYAELSA
jgi:hypothetical protein